MIGTYRVTKEATSKRTSGPFGVRDGFRSRVEPLLSAGAEALRRLLSEDASRNTEASPTAALVSDPQKLKSRKTYAPDLMTADSA